MPYKQVIVVRKDLKMGAGKAAAQAAHASLEAYKKAGFFARKRWEAEGSKKVVLSAESAGELKSIFEKAIKAKLPCSLIRDAGKTQIEKGTLTAVGIGPAKEEKIDRITGKLKMF